jgi:hypothetical protein
MGSRFGLDAAEESLLHLPGIETKFLCLPALQPVAIPTEISRLLLSTGTLHSRLKEQISTSTHTKRIITCMSDYRGRLSWQLGLFLHTSVTKSN